MLIIGPQRRDEPRFHDAAQGAGLTPVQLPLAGLTPDAVARAARGATMAVVAYHLDHCRPGHEDYTSMAAAADLQKAGVPVVVATGFSEAQIAEAAAAAGAAPPPVVPVHDFLGNPRDVLGTRLKIDG